MGFYLNKRFTFILGRNFNRVKMKFCDIKGLVAAPVTPMYANGELNYDEIENYVDALVAQGILSAFVNGTNGEGPSLTVPERKKSVDMWVKYGKNKLTSVIAQVGGSNLWETKELARHASGSGCHAIAVLPPSFQKPATVDLLVDFLVEEAKEAPELPLMYYHFPQQTGLTLDFVAIVDECVKRVPTFCGAKFTDYDLLGYGRALLNKRYGADLCLAYARDEQVVAALMLGTRVAIGGTYNYAGKLYNRMFDAVVSGDLKTASECQQQSQRFIDVFLSHGFDIGVNKSVVEMLTGVKCGPPRLPLLPASQEKLDAIKRDLTAVGFFEFTK